MLSNNVCRADRDRCCCRTNRKMNIVIHCPTNRQPNSNWNFSLIHHWMRVNDSEVLFSHLNRRWNLVRCSVLSHFYFSARFSLDYPRRLMFHSWNWTLCYFHLGWTYFEPLHLTRYLEKVAAMHGCLMDRHSVDLNRAFRVVVRDRAYRIQWTIADTRDFVVWYRHLVAVAFAQDAD